MTEYIDRSAFLEKERRVYCETCKRRENSKGKVVYEIGEAPCRACGIGDVLDDLEDVPAADVVERKTGKWKDKGHNNIYQCSVCGDMWMGIGGYRFCPNCGADMREES